MPLDADSLISRRKAWRHATLVVALALSSLLLACTPEDAAIPALAAGPAAPRAHAGTGRAIEPSRSAGCANPAAASGPRGKTLVRDTTSAGVPRHYRVHIGASAKTDQPMAVVLNFHGRGGTGEAIESYSGLLPVSDREGFLLVSPDGLGSPTGWSAGASLPGWPVDDVQFIRELLTTLKQDYCIDTGRLYAAGHSNGAFMASLLACETNGEIAAIAPVAGVNVPSGGCRSQVPVLAFHGTADDTVPFRGGMVRDTLHYQGAEDEFAAWAKQDHCSGPANYEQVSAHVTLEWYGSCSEPVSMFMVGGADHGWPGYAGTPVANELNTAELIWSFFKDQRAAGS